MRLWPVLLASIAGLAAPASAASAAPGARALAEARQIVGEQALAVRVDPGQVERAGGLWHVYLQPLVGGVPEQDALATLHLTATGRLVSRSAPTALPARLQGGWRLSRTDAVTRVLALLGHPKLRAPVQARRVARLGVAAWEVLVPVARPFGDWRVTLAGSDGRLLDRRDMADAANGQGLVFDPDPVSELGVAPPDDHDSDSPELTAALRQRTLPELDGTGALDGPYAQVTGPEPAAEPNLQFLFHRDDPRFEQVMAYFHITTAGEHYRALGFETGAPVTVQADAIADDNSFFSAATRTITLGTGGVDDGEDAEVIVHEYGHALQSLLAPGFPASPESSAVAEGYADYVAASYAASRGLDAARQTCLFAWDASSLGLPCGRRLDAGLVYPTDITGEPHADGQIWSQALWTLRSEIGPDLADRLALASSAYLQPTSGMPAAAAALVQADVDLDGGAHLSAITAALAPRGLLGGSSTTPANPNTTRVRLLGATMRGHLLEIVVRSQSRTRVALQLRTHADGLVGHWHRILAPGRTHLRLWVGVRPHSTRFRVVYAAASGAPVTLPVRLLPLRKR